MWMFLVGVGVRFGNLLCGGFLGGFYGCHNTVACGGFGGSGLGVSGCVGNCTCCGFVFGLFDYDGLVLLEVVWVCRA